MGTLNTPKSTAKGMVRTGTNQIGRYALHFHHDFGPGAPPNGYQFTLVGNAIDDASKWGITVHNSHYGLIQDNIVYNSRGAGIVTEDGTESFNVFDHNFACARPARVTRPRETATAACRILAARAQASGSAVRTTTSATTSPRTRRKPARPAGHGVGNRPHPEVQGRRHEHGSESLQFDTSARRSPSFRTTKPTARFRAASRGPGTERSTISGSGTRSKRGDRDADGERWSSIN